MPTNVTVSVGHWEIPSGTRFGMKDLLNKVSNPTAPTQSAGSGKGRTGASS